MGIDRIKGKIVFTCDDCGIAYVETDESDFESALEVFRSDDEGQNWETVKEEGEFKNYCTDCKQQH
jgi:hypothetical protein